MTATVQNPRRTGFGPGRMPELIPPTDLNCPSTWPRHGTSWAYRRHGCRCPEAIADDREKESRRQANARARMRTGTGQRGRWADDQPDHVVVELLCSGVVVAVVHKADRMHAVARLTRAGLTGFEVAQRLRVDRRTVFRYRTMARQAGLLASGAAEGRRPTVLAPAS